MKNTLPEKINQAVSESGLSDLTKAEKIASNYAPFMADVNDQMQIVKTLRKGEKEDLEKARRVRIDLGRIASACEKQKKADKELLLIETRFIDKLFGVVEGAARLTQNEAKEIEEYFERQEAERLAKIQQDRVALIQPYLQEGVPHHNYSLMTDDVWQNYLTGAKVAYDARIEAEKKAEQERIERERLDALERKRIVEVSRYAKFVTEQFDLRNGSEEDYQKYLQSLIEAEANYEAEQEKIRLEAERLRKEAEFQEKELEKERARAAEQKRLSEEKARKEKEESDRKIREAQELARKAEAELKAKADAEAKAKKDAELAAKKAAAAPDREKFIALIMQIEAIQMPLVVSEEAKEIILNVKTLLSKFSNYINEKSENL